MMMPTVDELVARAKAAYRERRAAEARQLLLDAVQRDPNHEEAWLWLSGLVDTLEEQQICLENVLALNPTHQRARQGLASIEQKMASASVNHAGRTRPAPPPARDLEAPATSVEWTRTDGPSVYGSGKQVALPTDSEYEAWVNELHLATDNPPAPQPTSPFVEDDPGRFGDTAYMVDTGPFMDDSPLNWPTAEPSVPDVQWPSVPRAGRPPQLSPVATEGFAGGDARDTRGVWPAPRATPEPPVAQPAGAARPTFSFDDDEDVIAASGAPVAPIVPMPPPAPTHQTPSTPPPPEPDSFYAYIPAEVTAPRRSGRRSMVLVAVAVILIIANAAAVIALVSAL